MHDKSKQKINLAVGAFRTLKGAPYVLNVVREVELEMAKEIGCGRSDHEYTKISGMPRFRQLAGAVILGDNCLRFSFFLVF